MSLSEQAERVRIAVYRQLAEHGTAPDRSSLAGCLELDASAVDDALVELAETRHIVLADGEIEMAHPFATRSFGFSVMGPHTLWWGGCAWDAFAIPHIVPGTSEVLVATTCPACSSAHAWTVTDQSPPRGEQVAHFLVPAAEIWPDASHACENQSIFCSEDCVGDWLQATGATRGYTMSLTTLWNLASRWYEGRLDSPYVRREPIAAAEYFRSVGLRGAFWGLPDE